MKYPTTSNPTIASMASNPGMDAVNAVSDEDVIPSALAESMALYVEGGTFSGSVRGIVCSNGGVAPVVSKECWYSLQARNGGLYIAYPAACTIIS